MKIRIALAAAALFVAGCDTPSAIDGYTEDVRLEFSARSDISGPSIPEPELTFTGGDGEIVVEGRFSAGNPCQDVTANAVSENGRLKLVVRVHAQQVICMAVVAHFEYTARVLELPPGRYDLSVVHEYSGRTLFRRETQVTVR